MCNPDPKQVVRIRATLYTLYRFADQPGFFNVFLPARAWRRNCEDASSIVQYSPMKGPLKLVMKTPLHRPIDPSTHRPMDQSTWQHLWPLISAKVSWTAAICREARSSLWILSSSSDAKCMFGSMAKPSPSATHGNSYFNFSGFLPWESWQTYISKTPPSPWTPPALPACLRTPVHIAGHPTLSLGLAKELQPFKHLQTM